MSDQHTPDPLLRSGAEERDYLLGRAEDHRELAERADPASRTIHLRLRQLYQERAALIGMAVQD